MNKHIFIVLLASQLCSSATIDEAKEALEKLRFLTTYSLEDASSNHTQMSDEIYTVALWAKDHGLREIKKKSDKFLAKHKAEKVTANKCRGSRKNAINHFEKTNSEELLLCIENQANEGVNVISKMKMALDGYISKGVHDEEKKLIGCGKLDEGCLERVAADIRDKIGSVVAIIEDEITIHKYSVEKQLDLIKDCTYQSIANTELSLETISSCLY